MEPLTRVLPCTSATSTCINLIEHIKNDKSHDDSTLHKPRSFTTTNTYGFDCFSLFLTLPYFNYTEAMRAPLESEWKTTTAKKANNMHPHVTFEAIYCPALGVAPTALTPEPEPGPELRCTSHGKRGSVLE